uniref:hypothetical protein n=1 Tax=Bradyrhizobium sp. (strain ORS 278) TaxID=114615 RepID=UPI0005A0D842|nr:hypothetical protein [Bradyrhizobium sp. ORS 278]
MTSSITKTWLGIGVVTIALLIAGSAATSPATAASFGVQTGRSLAATEIGSRRPIRSRSIVSPPRYIGRPNAYVPAYPPDSTILFTPFLD